MHVAKRIVLLLGLSLITAIVLLRSSIYVPTKRSPRHGPQISDLSDLMDLEHQEQTLQPTDLPAEPSSFKPAYENQLVSDEPSPYLQGKTKIDGSTYTKAVVMGYLSIENTTWLDTADLPPEISKYIYSIDRSSSPLPSSTILSIPKPRGHEAMPYLTYIIDHYADLADVSVFLHAHQLAWHNNEMLNHDAVEMIKRLSAEHVTRQGYMNLRCNWKPGCPEYIHPKTKLVDNYKKEEGAMAAAWAVLFPGEELPDVLASPCCAQFAVSKERIREIPLETFVRYRNWLLKTPLDDYVSGRVFEYIWHKVFTGKSTYCPEMRVCYCDGYGVCFENDDDFDYWFELRWKKRTAEKSLDAWRAQIRKLDEQRVKGQFRGQGIKSLEVEELKVPAVNGDVVLQREIDEYEIELERRRLRALRAGTDPQIRARVAGRPWTSGDGY